MPRIELNKIKVNPINPRYGYSKESLDELASSFKHVGIIEPIMVRPIGKNDYEVVVGERRYRAAKIAGMDKIPVIIRDLSDEEILEISLIENIQRENLNAVDKGKACKLMLKRFPERYPTKSALARKLGLSSNVAIDSWLHLAEMPVQIQRRIAPATQTTKVPEGKIDYRTATMVTRKITHPKRAIEVVRGVAERRVTRQAAIKIARQAEKQPKKTIEKIIREVVDEAPIYLPFSKAHADAILKGEKLQTARKSKDPRLLIGSKVRAQITHFADLEIININRKRLSDFDEEDAIREGGYTLKEFKKVWKRIHGEWNPNEIVHVIQFKLLNVVSE